MLYKPASEPQNPSDPSPQWIAKHGGTIVKQDAGKGPLRPLKRYQTQSFIEQHGHTLPPEIELAIGRFLQDSEYHARIRTGDLNSNGGGSGGRLGGLGNCPQHVRDGHARHSWLERQLNGNKLFYHVLEKLLYRTQPRFDGRPFNLEDFGKLLWPALNDQNALRYSTKTAVMAFGAELLKLYAHPQCPVVRWISEEERMLEAQER
ncbi:MAG TPA: hypothetical protein VG897_15420 [Terriglobales bacterium]|nr:hypothetical protein [Terriglobales bacterium]